MYIKKVTIILVFSLFSLGGCLAQKNEKEKTEKKTIENVSIQSSETPINMNGWLLNYEDAYNKATSENKAIMANFTGSDWCGWCKKLKKAVFDTQEFKEWAEDNVVLFELDYPRRTPQDPAIKQQNTELQQTFRSVVRGYPTVLIFDIERSFEDGAKKADGIKLHGKMGYMGDPKSFIKMAETYLSNR